MTTGSTGRWHRMECAMWGSVEGLAGIEGEDVIPAPLVGAVAAP